MKIENRTIVINNKMVDNLKKIIKRLACISNQCVNFEISTLQEIITQYENNNFVNQTCGNNCRCKGNNNE